LKPKIIILTPPGSGALETSLPAELAAGPATVDPHVSEEGSERSNWSDVMVVAPGTKPTGTSMLVPGNPADVLTLRAGDWAEASAGLIRTAASTAAAKRWQRIRGKNTRLTDSS
jgi:hypothetical protein